MPSSWGKMMHMHVWWCDVTLAVLTSVTPVYASRINQLRLRLRLNYNSHDRQRQVRTTCWKESWWISLSVVTHYLIMQSSSLFTCKIPMCWTTSIDHSLSKKRRGHVHELQQALAEPPAWMTCLEWLTLRAVPVSSWTLWHILRPRCSPLPFKLLTPTAALPLTPWFICSSLEITTCRLSDCMKMIEWGIKQVCDTLLCICCRLSSESWQRALPFHN